MKGAKIPKVAWADVEIVSRELMVYLVEITVEGAVKWLEGNTHNRAIRDGVVERYAQDIKARNFPVTHQGVAFDATGRLIDGQHRLYGILEANVPATLLVFVGVPAATQAFIDQGASRSTLDVLALEGNDKANAYRLSVARRASQGTLPQHVLTRKELIDFFERHQKAVLYVTDEVFQKRKVRYVMPAAVGAVLLRASYHEDHAKLNAFGRILLDGIAPKESDSYAISLQRWLLNGAPAERSWAGSRDMLVYCKAQLCPHHHVVYGDDGAAANRIMCDFFHRGKLAPRLTEQERNDEAWAQAAESA
jgi:hypothetical protein